MEHLPSLCHSPCDSRLVTPYVCRQSYDGGTFLTYPLRVDRAYLLPEAEPESGRLPLWHHEKIHPTPTQHLEDLLQTWLFFGLLHELLGDICQAEEFISSDSVGGNKTLTTSGLLDKVNLWVGRLRENLDRHHYDHIAECLRLTNTTMRAVSMPLLYLLFNSFHQIMFFHETS